METPPSPDAPDPAAPGPRSGGSTEIPASASPDGLFRLDAEARWRTVNPALCAILGETPETLRGRPLVENVLLEDREKAGRLVDDASRFGRRGQAVVRVRTREGDVRHVRIAVATAPGAPDEDVGPIGTVTDVTDLVARSARAADAARREATTSLADGAAHAFSELLTAVMGNADLALLNVNTPETCRDHLRAVLRAVLRARDLSEQLRAYGGRQPCALVEEDLTDLVRRVEPLVRQVLPPEVELHVALPGGPLPAKIHGAQLGRALLTLMVRAGRAIGDQLGLITLDITRRTLPARKAQSLRVPAGPTAVLELTDTGRAIPPRERETIFEPFKDRRGLRGSGLELATVQGIVERHGGRVVVRSAEGQGTTFTLYLPLQDVGEAEVTEPEASTSSSPRMALPEIRRVAVVEDDGLVRNTLVAMLHAYEIETVVPRSPEHALEVLSTKQKRVDALVTDVRMPGMTGPELTTAIRAVHPDLPVLLVSGYSDVSMDEICAATHAVGFLPKPFTANQLMAALRALMILPRRGRSHADRLARVPHSFR